MSSLHLAVKIVGKIVIFLSGVNFVVSVDCVKDIKLENI